MHLLDRLAALAIILQFVLIAVFGWAIYGHMKTQDAILSNIQAKVYETPTIAPMAVTTSPTPSVLLKSASTGATLPIKVTK